ncbi:hypothetical protein [Caulobacter flavus]|nr:hypothetical protein [Caulobacter flavus]
MDSTSEGARRRAVSDRIDIHDAKLQAAAVRANGRIQDILQVLHIAKTTFSQRLSRLRVAGRARTITTINPLSGGRPHQFTAWVKLGVLTLETIARFEDGLIDDCAVFAAQRVAGDVDYRLSTFHASPGDAAAWLAAIRANPNVARAIHAPVRHLFGHGLEGVVLTPPVKQRGRRARSAAAKGSQTVRPSG